MPTARCEFCKKRILIPYVGTVEVVVSREQLRLQRALPIVACKPCTVAFEAFFADEQAREEAECEQRIFAHQSDPSDD